MDFLSTLKKSDVPAASYKVYAWPNARATDFLGGDQWQTVSALRFTIDDDGQAVIVVPAGFIVDRKALPWSIRWFAPIWGRHSAASIIYRYLVEGHMTNISGIPTRLTRQEIHYASMGLIGADKSFGFWAKIIVGLHLTWLSKRGKYYDVEINPNKLFFEVEYELRKNSLQVVSND